MEEIFMHAVKVKLRTKVGALLFILSVRGG